MITLAGWCDINGYAVFDWCICGSGYGLLACCLLVFYCHLELFRFDRAAFVLGQTIFSGNGQKMPG